MEQRKFPGAWAVARFLDESPVVAPPVCCVEFEQLEAEGLGGLVLDGWRSAFTEKPYLKERFITYLSWEMRCLFRLKEIGVSAQRLGIPVLVFKGCSLAASVYPRPGLRTFGDIDICVPVQHKSSFEALLLRSGFKGQAGYCVFSLDGLALDLHDHPLNQLSSLLSPEGENWWSGATLLAEVTGPVLRLDYRLELALTLLHSAKHSFSRAAWLIDLVLVGRQLGSQELQDVIDRYHLHYHLYIAVQCYRAWFAIEPPVWMNQNARGFSKCNFLGRYYLRLVLERKASDFLGKLTPILAIQGLRPKIFYAWSAVFPSERWSGQRLRKLKELFRIALERALG
jgi:hypothetical protein